MEEDLTVPDSVTDLIKEVFVLAIDKYGVMGVAKIIGVRPGLVKLWASIPDDAGEHELPTSTMLRDLRARLLLDMATDSGRSTGGKRC